MCVLCIFLCLGVLVCLSMYVCYAYAWCEFARACKFVRMRSWNIQKRFCCSTTPFNVLIYLCFFHLAIASNPWKSKQKSRGGGKQIKGMRTRKSSIRKRSKRFETIINEKPKNIERTAVRCKCYVEKYIKWGNILLFSCLWTCVEQFIFKFVVDRCIAKTRRGY